MSRLASLLEPIRAAYIRRFETVLRDVRRTTRRVTVEPELRDAAKELIRRGALVSPARLDVMAVTTYGSVKAFAVDSDDRVEFPLGRFDEAGLDIGIAPFHWESMELWIDGAADAVANAPARWFEAAFTPAESVSASSLRNVAHFISDPIYENGLTSCVIDLGTAPVARVALLLDFLRSAGVRRVDLGRLQT